MAHDDEVMGATVPPPASTLTASGAGGAITRRYALVVVTASFAIAMVVRWGIVAVASHQARSQISGLQTILLGLALALVVGYMVAVIAVGVGMRNRHRGGLFTLAFALNALAVHVFAGITQGMGMLAVPLPATTDFSSLFLIPLLYTVPAAALRVIPWRWTLVIGVIGIMVASALTLVTR